MQYKGKLNAMQEGREKPYTVPKVFSRPSRTHPTLFLFPSTALWEKNRTNAVRHLFLRLLLGGFGEG
jgi:hypothetical protein